MGCAPEAELRGPFFHSLKTPSFRETRSTAWSRSYILFGRGSRQRFLCVSVLVLLHSLFKFCAVAFRLPVIFSRCSYFFFRYLRFIYVDIVNFLHSMHLCLIESFVFDVFLACFSILYSTALLFLWPSLYTPRKLIAIMVKFLYIAYIGFGTATSLSSEMVMVDEAGD